MVVVDADPPRAYPVRVLSHHEIVNDRLDGSAGTVASADGRPVAVTWCPICWSGAVYDRRVDGRELTFGVSGKLADDALVMYDRETGTEWKQPTGEAIAGELVGHRLDCLATSLVTYGRFRADGTAWDPVTGESADGRVLERVPAVRLFAFAWQDAHGPDAFFFADRDG